MHILCHVYYSMSCDLKLWKHIFHYLIFLGTPSLTEEVTEAIDDLYRNRLRTLQSVDDLVAAVVASLEVSSVWTSDHYLLFI